MGLMLSTDMTFSDKDAIAIAELAARAVEYAVHEQSPLPIIAEDYPERLRVEQSSFVTLKRSGNLRGCIGSLIALRPLVADISENCYAAAFRDPRFGPLRTWELADIEIYVSVLSEHTPIEFGSEAELLAALKPGVDGLTLSEGDHRGSFLPVMWDRLPEPQEFIKQLKIKAGLPPTYWSDTVEVHRFTAQCFPPEPKH